MQTTGTSAWALAALAWAAMACSPLAAQTGSRAQPLRLVPGSGPVVVKGTIKGRDSVDYRVRASAGQTLTVTLRGSNPQNHFNVLAPGSADVAMFIGQDGGGFERVLVSDGMHTVRVYLMRAAARRGESSRYTLALALAGQPLRPVPASRDAVIPGTPFHAATSVDCTPPQDSTPRSCEALVIRRGFDGTATVEIRTPGAPPRRVLFVRAQPVSTDATGTLVHTREGASTIVRIDETERYIIPDALVGGG